MPDNLINIGANYIKPAPIESTRRGLLMGAVAHLERPKNDFSNEIISDYFVFFRIKNNPENGFNPHPDGVLIRNKLVLKIRKLRFWGLLMLF